jgi:hypothetical protein
VIADFARRRVSLFPSEHCFGAIHRDGFALVGPRGGLAAIISVRVPEITPALWADGRVNPSGIAADSPELLSSECSVGWTVSLTVVAPPGDIIVGIRLHGMPVTRGKVWGVCHGHRVMFGQHGAQISLALHEREDTEVVAIEADASDHIQIQGFQVFVHCATHGEIGKLEEPPRLIADVKAQALERLSRALTCGDQEEADENSALVLVESLNTDRRLAPFARAVWATEIVDLFPKATVVPELVPDFWSDYPGTRGTAWKEYRKTRLGKAGGWADRAIRVSLTLNWKIVI